MGVKLMSALIPTICASCAELLISPAITEPHPNMALRHKHADGSPDNHDGEYVCLECDSTWELRFENKLLVNAKMIDLTGTRTSCAVAGCPRPYHNPSRQALCQAVQRPRRSFRTI